MLQVNQALTLCPNGSQGAECRQLVVNKVTITVSWPAPLHSFPITREHDVTREQVMCWCKKVREPMYAIKVEKETRYYTGYL